MNIDIKKQNSFIEMMTEVANNNDCRIDFELYPNDINTMKVHIVKGTFGLTHYIKWDQAKSQTQVSTDIWARFFANYYNDPVVKYCNNDIAETENLYNRIKFTIKDVIFNDPATIVFWADNTKTVVKCQDGDEFDPEKGLAMAISKRAFGNKGNYCNQITKWTEKYCRCLYPDVVGMPKDEHEKTWQGPTLADLIEERIKKILNSKGIRYDVKGE